MTPDLERNPNNIHLWKAAAFLSSRERYREPIKGPTHKILFVVACLGISKGKAGLEMFDESLGIVALGRELKRAATGIPVLSHLPYCRTHLAQVDHSPPSGISLKGNNSPSYRNYSTPPYGASAWLLIADWLDKQLKESATDGKFLIVLKRLLKARLGYHLTSLGTDAEKEDSGKHEILLRWIPPRSYSWFVLFSLLCSFLTFISCCSSLWY